MTREQITSMSTYYAEMYGNPTSDSDAINKLADIYEDLFDEVPTQEVKEGIAEYYRILINRGLPAYLWILEGLHVTSKKEKSKRNFPYVVGMLRTWMKYGFGHIPNQEEEELIEYFKEVTGFEVSLKARRVMQSLMGRFGLVKVTRMINELKNDTDMSLILMLQLQTMMEDKFEVSNESEDSAENTISA